MEPPILTDEQDEQEEKKIYPSLLNRVQAMFFDLWIVIAIVMLLSAYVFEAYEKESENFRILLFFIVVFIYEPVGTMAGGTIGYRTMGMKIRRSDDQNKRVNVIQAYGRSVIKLMLGWVSFLTISGDPQRRAIHDKAVGSVVLFAKS